MKKWYTYTILHLNEPLSQHRFSTNSIVDETVDVPDFGNTYLPRLRHCPRVVFEPASETINRILKYSISSAALR